MSEHCTLNREGGGCEGKWNGRGRGRRRGLGGVVGAGRAEEAAVGIVDKGGKFRSKGFLGANGSDTKGSGRRSGEDSGFEVGELFAEQGVVGGVEVGKNAEDTKGLCTGGGLGREGRDFRVGKANLVKGGSPEVGVSVA